VKIRQIQPQDRGGLETLLCAQTHFHPEEVRIALELIDMALAHPGEEDYMILCAEEKQEEVQGYICFGKAPLTDAVYDIYWIVVHPAFWNLGVGSALLRMAEEEMARRKGRLLLIETSSTPPYKTPRAFYRRRGYLEMARVPDYYRAGDDKVIFGKTLT